MARTFGRLFGSMWDEDEEFLAMGADAKYVYNFLVAQRDLGHSGVIALRIAPWARRLGIGVDRTEAALKELHDERFVVIDHDEMLLLVRSLIRRDGVYKQPNVFKSAADQIYTVASKPIRAVLAQELERLDEEAMNADTRRLCTDLIAWLRKGSGNPSPDPSRKGSPKGSNADSSQVGHIGPAVEEPAGDKGSGNPSGNPLRARVRASHPPTPTLLPYPPPYPQAPAAAGGEAGGSVGGRDNDEERPPRYADAVALLSRLEPARIRPGRKGMHQVAPRVAELLALGWPESAIVEHVATDIPVNLRSIPGYLVSRLPMANPYRAQPAVKSRSPEVPWCGECDEADRTREDDEGAIYPCPTCNPRSRNHPAA